MNRQNRQEIGSFIIGFECRFRGTVFLHSIIYLGETGCAAFGKLELFQKISDTPVPVFAGDDAFLFQHLVIHRWQRDGKTKWHYGG